MIIGELLLGEFVRLFRETWREVLERDSRIRRFLKGESTCYNTLPFRSIITKTIAETSTLMEVNPEVIAKASRCYKWLVGASTCINTIALRSIMIKTIETVKNILAPPKKSISARIDNPI